MTQRQWFLLAGSLMGAAAWDYMQFKKARETDPTAPFKWDLAIARYVLITSTVMTGEELVTPNRATAVFL